MNNTVTTGPRWHRRTWTIGALLLTALMLLIAACGDDNNGAAEDISATAECDAEPVILNTDDGVDFVRTPDSCFENLPDFPYEAHYVEIDGLRQAYVDEGPADGEVVLLLHGQPSWSYLYRDMIPVFADAGYRVIAMDHLGMGRLHDEGTDPADERRSVANHRPGHRVGPEEPGIAVVLQRVLQRIRCVCEQPDGHTRDPFLHQAGRAPSGLVDNAL